MASMYDSGTAWFCLIVGAALVVEAAVLVVLRRRPGGGRRGPRAPMLLSMGVMLLSESVSRLGRLTGAGKTAASLVGMAGAMTTIVFAIRTLDARRRAAPQSQEDPGDWQLHA